MKVLIITESPVLLDLPGFAGSGRNHRDKFPKTPRLTATARRTRSRCQGSRPCRPPAANRQQDPQPGLRLTGTAARYKQRVSAEWVGPESCTYRPAARPAGGQPGRE